MDAHRVFIGLALVVHFFAAFRELPEVIGRSGLYLPTESPLSSQAFHAAFLWVEQYVSWAQLVTSLGLLLSVGITLGTAPRYCAILLFLSSTWIHRVAFAVTSLDDALVSVVAFWLCILPVGRTLRITQISQRNRWPEVRVEGWSTFLFVTHLLLLQADVSRWQEFAPTWYAVGRLGLALPAVSACLFLPSAAIRVAAMGVLVALHIWLAGRSGLGFAHCALIGCTILMCDARPQSAAEPAVKRPLTAGIAVGFTALMLSLVATAGTFALARTPEKPKAWAIATAIVLRDAGLLVGASGRRLAPYPLNLRFDSDDGTADLRIGGARGQLLLGYLMSPPGDPSEKVVARVTESIVRFHCRDGRRERGRMSLSGLEAASQRELTEYRCDHGDATLVPPGQL